MTHHDQVHTTYLHPPGTAHCATPIASCDALTAAVTRDAWPCLVFRGCGQAAALREEVDSLREESFVDIDF